MKVVTPVQMREIDSYTISSMGIPGTVLMENAALRVVDEIIKDLGNVKAKNICLFAGKGNNGGDAFAVARHLYNKGAKVTVFVLANKKDITGDARTNLDILEKMGVDTVEVLDTGKLNDMESILDRAELIVDGIFGTGLKGSVKGFLEEVIRLINNKNAAVLAVDIPSGINGETGEILGTCIKAYKTVTFGFPKLGHFLHPGCEYTGKLIVADISIPESAAQKFGINHFIMDEATLKSLMPQRRRNSNKGDYGKIFVITGSRGMTGAGYLAGAAALRTGAGLVYLGVPSSLVSVYDSNLIEAVTIPLEDKNLGYLSKECIPQVIKQLEGMDAVAIGPGISTKGDAADVVYNIVKNCSVPMVIDADGINAISKDVSILRQCKAKVVLTPHPGEMARLLGTCIKDVQKDRVNIARDFSAKWGVVTVLKGSRTIVAAPDGRVYINLSGNSGMATGGTGDVLTGIIAGLIGQGLEPVEASIAGVYLHGLSGDSVANIKGEHGLIAGDLVEELPYTIKRLIG